MYTARAERSSTVERALVSSSFPFFLLRALHALKDALSNRIPLLPLLASLKRVASRAAPSVVRSAAVYHPGAWKT